MGQQLVPFLTILVVLGATMKLKPAAADQTVGRGGRIPNYPQDDVKSSPALLGQLETTRNMTNIVTQVHKHVMQQVKKPYVGEVGMDVTEADMIAKNFKTEFHHDRKPKHSDFQKPGIQQRQKKEKQPPADNHGLVVVISISAMISVLIFLLVVVRYRTYVEQRYPTSQLEPFIMPQKGPAQQHVTIGMT